MLFQVEKVFPSPLLVTCPSVSHTACRTASTFSGAAWHLLSFVSFFPFSCSSVYLQILPACTLFLVPPPLLNQLWPSSLSRYSISPFFPSRVGGHTWALYDGSSFILPLPCLCMSLSLPIVLLLTCPCTISPHSSFLFPSLCFSYRTLTFFSFLSNLLFTLSLLLPCTSLLFIFIASYFWVLTFFALHSKTLYPLGGKCVSWLLRFKSYTILSIQSLKCRLNLHVSLQKCQAFNIFHVLKLQYEFKYIHQCMYVLN